MAAADAAAAEAAIDSDASHALPSATAAAAAASRRDSASARVVDDADPSCLVSGGVRRALRQADADRAAAAERARADADAGIDDDDSDSSGSDGLLTRRLGLARTSGRASASPGRTGRSPSPAAAAAARAAASGGEPGVVSALSLAAVRSAYMDAERRGVISARKRAASALRRSQLHGEAPPPPTPGSAVALTRDLRRGGELLRPASPQHRRPYTGTRCYLPPPAAAVEAGVPQTLHLSGRLTEVEGGGLALLQPPADGGAADKRLLATARRSITARSSSGGGGGSGALSRRSVGAPASAGRQPPGLPALQLARLVGGPGEGGGKPQAPWAAPAPTPIAVPAPRSTGAWLGNAPYIPPVQRPHTAAHARRSVGPVDDHMLDRHGVSFADLRGSTGSSSLLKVPVVAAAAAGAGTAHAGGAAQPSRRPGTAGVVRRELSMTDL